MCLSPLLPSAAACRGGGCVGNTVATEARHLSRLGLLSEFEQGGNTDSLRVCYNRDTACRVLLLLLAMCVTTETRHLDRLGQLGEFEQDSHTDSRQSTGGSAARSANKPQCTAEQRAEHSVKKPISDHTTT